MQARKHPVPQSMLINPALEAHRAPYVIASVTLAVRDLSRLAAFYRDTIGLELMSINETQAVLGVDGCSLLRLIWQPEFAFDPETPGLFHTAFLLPSQAALGRFLRHAIEAKLELEGASDHGVSEAIYLSDPEGNGVEIYCDRPRNEWPCTPNGTIAMSTDRLDWNALLATADPATSRPYHLATGSRVGHVHLCVSDLADALATVPDLLGMDKMCSYPSAHFFGSGGYHHHIATNTWRAKPGRVRKPNQLGLDTVTIFAADDAAYHSMRDKWLATGGVASDGSVTIHTLNGLTFALSNAESA